MITLLKGLKADQSVAGTVEDVNYLAALPHLRFAFMSIHPPGEPYS